MMLIFFQVNPWAVENVNAFYFLNCPECVYKSKEVESFEVHALQNHPQSFVLFKNIKSEENEFKDSENEFKDSETDLKDSENEFEKTEIKEDEIETVKVETILDEEKEEILPKIVKKSVRKQCKICNKTLAAGVYRRHMNTVHADKSDMNFECSLCPFKTYAQAYLKARIMENRLCVST